MHLLLALPLVAQAKKRIPPPEWVPPSSNFHVRAAFDTDPSVYLGRFIPDEAAVPDESAARKTSCSQYIDHREVGGGGVEYDEVFAATTDVALSVGVAQTDLKVGGEGGASASLRATYTMTRKLVADIADPVAFASSCRSSPDECTGRFVGEFLEGTGSIWTARSSSAEAKVLKALESVGLDVGASRGVSWARSRTFSQPVYFAFRVTEVPEVDCEALVNNPPKSENGTYFGAVSDPMPTERIARDMALASAREQAVRFLGESIAMGSFSETVIGGSAGQAAIRFDDQQFVERAAVGVARFVKDELSCIETSPTPDGVRYTARTLGHMPNAALDEAARAVLTGR